MRLGEVKMKLFVLLMVLCILITYAPATAVAEDVESAGGETQVENTGEVRSENTIGEAQAEDIAEGVQADDEGNQPEEDVKESPDGQTGEKEQVETEIVRDADEENVDVKGDTINVDADVKKDNVVSTEKKKSDDREETKDKENEKKTKEEDNNGQVLLIDGTDPAVLHLKAAGGALKSASTGSKLDPTKIKKVSWVHSSWSWLITAQKNKADGTHVRKITSVKDDEGNELLDQDGITAGYVYCTEPGTNTPEDLHFGHQFGASDGEYEAKNGETVQGKTQVIRVFNKESAKAAGTTYVRMRKLLYYLPGGDGWKSSTKTWYTNYKNTHGLGAEGENPGVTGYHELAHLALSKLWRDEGKAEHPVGDRWNADQLYSFCDTSTKNLIDKYVDYALDSSTADPPDDFLVLFISTHDAQDMWGVLGTLEDDSGWLQLQKKDAEKHFNYPDNYDLSGAVYYIYKDADCSKRARDVEGEKTELTTTSDGTTNKVELDTDTYWVKEHSAPANFLKDTKAHKVVVSSDDIKKNPKLLLVDEPDEFGHLRLKKTPEKKLPNHSERYSLSGAIYYVYMDAACTKRAKNTSGKEIALKTDSDGITQTEEVDIGDYWVKEITPSPGFNTDGSVKKATVTGSNTANDPLELSSLEPPKYGYLRADKQYIETPLNHPEKYKLSGAEYEVYTDSGLSIRALDADGKAITLVTDSGGVTQTVMLEPGDYWLSEKKPSEGCKADKDLASKSWKVEESDNPAKATVAHSKEPTDEGWLTLKKKAKNTDTKYTSKAPENYSLAGAVYYVYTDAACTRRARDRDSKKEITLTTDAKGNTGFVKVDIGDYYAKEIKAAKGFRLDTTDGKGNGAAKILKADVSAANTPEKQAVFISEDPPVWSSFDFRFEKKDKSGNYGYKKLLGCEYTLKYYDVDMGYGDEMPTASTIEGKKAARSWTWVTVKKTDAEGHPYAGIETAVDEPKAGSSPFYMEGDTKIIPRGVFTLEETKAASGLSRDETVYYGRVYQSSEGAAAAVSMDLGEEPSVKAYLYDEPQYPVIEIQKLDAETGEPTAAGADREYVKGSLEGAEYAVYFDDDTLPKAERVGTIITDENGFGKLESRTEGDERKLGDRLEPGLYIIEEEIAPPGYTLDSLFYKEDRGVYENGRHYVRARVKEGDTASFTYTVESKENSHKTHISKKDITTGEELPGARLQVLDSEGNIVEEWTSSDKPHDILALHDEKQGLKNGTYVLREVTAPYGYDIAEDVEFTVRSDKVENTVEMMNRPVRVSTTAKDVASMTHMGQPAGNSRIIDHVSAEGLCSGRTYKVVGTLMDKNTREALKDADGNYITAEKEFTADGESGEVDVEFTIDSSGFSKGTTIVVFEKLYRTSGVRSDDKLPVLLAGHEDMDDEAQAVHYGGIASTVALDKESGNHIVPADKKTTVIDTVSFSNLSTAETYVIAGELYDKTSGKLTGIRQRARFKPEMGDGEIDVEFRFDSSGMEGHTLVVFETLAVITKSGEEEKEVVIDKHIDPEDEAQTVHIPSIRTNASCILTGDHIAGAAEKTEIRDVVKYTNLLPGRKYRMNGTLMNKKTGKPVKENGKAVKVEKEFTPPEADGEVELLFTFNSKELEGGTAVVFEECTYKGCTAAVHMDLSDEAQSIHIPEIRTVISSAENKMAVDKVKYKNLIPDREYVIRGWLVDKSNGEKIPDSDGETRFTPEKADGSADVTLSLGETDVTAVAFEECYFVTAPDANGNVAEVLVGKHADIKSRAQTVRPASRIGRHPDTGDRTMLMLWLGVAACSAILLVILARKISVKENV